MANSIPRRKIAVILATDVVGYSTKMEENEVQTINNLKACRKIIDGLINEHHGRIFNVAGDSVLAEFQSAVEAVICASEFQKKIKERNNYVSEEEELDFRIGINMGDVVIEGDNLYGEGVNVAARLEAFAQPGGVCLSKNVHEIVNRKTNFKFHDLGEQTVKNTVLHAFDVTFEGSSRRNIPELKVTKKSSSKKPPAIAVLPFSNIGGDPEQEYFADGITEDIITNLSLWRTFPVVSRNSSFTFRGKSLNLKQVTSELNARYLVEGSVRKGGNRVRISAQLIDAEEDHHLWSEKWDRTIDDIFDVQDEISEAIARRVNPSITVHELKRLNRSRPQSMSAWEEYLQGLKLYNDRNYSDLNNQGLSEACTHFEKAIELDDTLSDAYAYLALCGFWDLVHFTTEDSKATLDKMKFYGRKAETINPENPLALIGLAAHFFFSGDFPNALNYAERAVKFNPSFTLSNWWLGLIQAHAGRFKESEDSILKALELSPIDPELERIYGALYCSYLGQQRYQEALEASDKALQYHPDQGHMLGWRAAALGHLGFVDDAKFALNKYLALRPNLKTRENFRQIFVPNSMLTDPIIEGLVKAGWEPES